MRKILLSAAIISALIFWVGGFKTHASNATFVNTTYVPTDIIVVSIEPVALELPEISEKDIDCMTQNIYFEARNQSEEGQYAVAEVVLNRTEDPEFPDNVCDVIKEKNTRVCQFSWYCDGLPDQMRDREAIALAREIAIASLISKTNYTEGAKFYHAEYVSPGWNKKKKTKQIQDHIFYTSI